MILKNCFSCIRKNTPIKKQLVDIQEKAMWNPSSFLVYPTYTYLK